MVMATNSIASIDPALLRPGRFDLIIPIGAPDQAGRTELAAEFLEKCDAEADRRAYGGVHARRLRVGRPASLQLAFERALAGGAPSITLRRLCRRGVPDASERPRRSGRRLRGGGRCLRPTLNERCRRGRLSAMKVHLVDGTYELFRHFFGAPRTAPRRRGGRGRPGRGRLGPAAAGRGRDARRRGHRPRHRVLSQRLWPGYKTGGRRPDLWPRPGPRGGLGALGVLVWPMVEVEADDALASAAAVAADDPRWSRSSSAPLTRTWASASRDPRGAARPAEGHRDRRRWRHRQVRRRPASIPDYLALVGDSADGFPGLAGWGAKSAATVLARWRPHRGDPSGPRRLGRRCPGRRQAGDDLATRVARHARLFKELATLRIDRSLLGDVDELRWRGPTDDFAALCADLDAPGIARRAEALAATR